LKKILFISLAVVLALGFGLIGCEGEGEGEPECPDVIMIGTARDTDEGMGVFECYHGGPAMRWFVNKVNAAGGVHLSAYDTATEDCYVDLELVVREFSVGAWDIGTVVQGLIDDGADVIFGGPSTDTVYTLAPVCNLNGVILMSFEGGASKMVWESESYLDQWPFVWINLSFANWYEIPVLKGIMDEAVGGTPKAYVTQIGGPGAEHGLEYLQTTVDEFGSGNVLPSDSGLVHSFFMTQGEADTIIQGAITALNSTPYDIFCAYTYPWNVAALFIAAQTYGFNPPAMIFGPGSSQGYFPLAWGDSAIEGIMSFGTANEKTTVAVGTPTQSMADMYAEIGAQIEDDWTNYSTVCPNSYNATAGTELLDFWGLPIFAAGMEMWLSAVEEVGDLDDLAIRNVMASYNSTNPASTVFGDTWYTVFGGGLGGGIVAYECETGQIGQWQSGVFEILGYSGITSVLPNNDATSTYIAMEDNWAWLP
jgi:hypothetical protein